MKMNRISRKTIKKEISTELEKVLKKFIDDTKNNNVLEANKTARRILNVWYEMAERTSGPPSLKWFKTSFTGFLIKGPIEAYSLCPHHMLPIRMKILVGIVPKGYTLGISKITRLVLWASKGFFIQEEITKIIADKLWEKDKLEGLIIGVIGEHSCEKIRGVKSKNDTVTIEIRGRVDKKSIFIFNRRLQNAANC
jgi:GTP cyclohydrolase I